ncbi:voltage-gated chloride channel protein, partial [bacterium]|nr:voltage-gated chloride channel protein [bacterium]
MKNISHNFQPMNITRAVRHILLSSVTGCLAGTAATLFLYLLDWVTQTRIHHPWLIWGLPLAGLLIGWLYHHFGQELSGGHSLILDEIHDPKQVLPIKMAPFVLFGTLLTHLCGGSSGREGTAVQMGASLSDQLSRIVKL